MKRLPSSTVLIIDPEPVARHGLVSLIKSHAALRVAGEAESIRCGRDLCLKLKPHIVVIDPAMEGGEGFVFIEEIPRWAARARVVAFSAREDASGVRRVLKAGACGYIARRDPVVSLIKALVAATEGQRYVGPRIEHALLAHIAGDISDVEDDVEGLLSSRELQVFRLVGEAKSLHEISESLGVSAATIESHKQRIRFKLKLASAAELRRKATLYAVTPTTTTKVGARARSSN